MPKWILKKLPDGTKKLEKVPLTPEEIQKKEEQSKEHQQRKKLRTEERKEREFPLDEFSEMAEEKRAKFELFKAIKGFINIMSSCWIWTGDDKEYEKIKLKVYETFKEKNLNGKKIVHKCDNSKCINPNYLYSTEKEEQNEV